jgi:3-oxoacyl-[acyl-carrier-protein] synthase II
MKRRVVVTGAGLISPLGGDVETFWRRLCSGETGIRPHPHPGIELAVGWIDFDPGQAGFTRQHIHNLDRVSLMALYAAEHALQASGLSPETGLGDHAGVLLGTGMGGAESLEDAYAHFFGVVPTRKKVLTVPAAMAHAPASQIGLRFGVTGECQTYSVACSSSAVAIGEAYRRIQDGHLDIALAGGAECMLHPGVIDTWRMMKVLCQDPPAATGQGCQPFSAGRTGFAMSEGAAILVLEPLDAARARGATPWCELVGYGVSNDASHITKPNPVGQARAIRRALAHAQIEPTQIGHINAHGTATQAGDAIETESIKAVFGEHAYRIPVSATKSSHGHLIGATSALEFIATMQALRQQIVPPTAYWRSRDPRCDLDYVPGQARAAPGLEYAISNSFAFGGNNAVLVARRWSE